MIKWLEGYFISSKFDRDISIQSCSSNLRTPCMCGISRSLMDMPPPLMLAADAAGSSIVSERTTIATERNNSFSMLQKEKDIIL